MSRETEYRRNRSQSQRNQAYVSGSAARRLAAQENEKQRREDEQKRRSKRSARMNQERAKRVGAGYVFFCTVALALTCVLCVTYIRLQSNITSNLKNISAVESQLQDLKADNDAAKKRIETNNDLEKIKSSAINDLGMTYPDSSQIVYYSVSNDDFMNQYADIPSK